jgi:hypothetical protein
VRGALDVLVVFIVPVVSAVLAAGALWYAWWTKRQVLKEQRRQRRLEDFRQVRAWMRELGSDRKITEAAHRAHAELLAAAPMNLFIADPAWILAEPLELDQVDVRLTEENEVPPVAETGYEPLLRYWPLGGDDRPLRRYHEAVSQFGPPPRLWFNWPSYRLLGVGRRADGGFDLRVGTTTYWDGFDCWSALHFEAACQLRASEAARKKRATADASINGPYRESLKSPFTLANRNCAIGLSVLTVYRTPKGAFFYLQRRAAAQVATLGGMAGLFPAGEFQPSSKAHAAIRPDADIWRCVMREFAEEFFGREDLNERGALVDYERESPFRELQQARERGRVRPYVLDGRRPDGVRLRGGRLPGHTRRDAAREQRGAG